MARSISTTDVLQLILDDDDGDEVFLKEVMLSSMMKVIMRK